MAVIPTFVARNPPKGMFAVAVCCPSFVRQVESAVAMSFMTLLYFVEEITVWVTAGKSAPGAL
jgi:hypothetical protein